MTEIKEATPDQEWVMVPMKPTREMCFAGATAGWAANNVETATALDVYRAMLAARPVPSTEGWEEALKRRSGWLFGSSGSKSPATAAQSLMSSLPWQRSWMAKVRRRASQSLIALSPAFPLPRLRSPAHDFIQHEGLGGEADRRSRPLPK